MQCPTRIANAHSLGWRRRYVHPRREPNHPPTHALPTHGLPSCAAHRLLPLVAHHHAHRVRLGRAERYLILGEYVPTRPV
eukprot:4576870-Prymnesium_polylepis.1